MKGTDNSRWLALAALMLAVLAVGLDGTILGVALPTLAGALHATETDLQWFSSGYLLVLAAGMLPAGLLGDRYGRKKVMLGALALFGAGSAACAFAPSAAWFIAARAVLGLAGAALIVMALSAITVLFAPEERPRAVGVWATANFLALPIGPILGGWLLTHYWWGWVFLINVPVALLGLVASLALVPESRATERPGLDPAGVASSTAGLVLLTYGMIQAGQSGWTGAGAVAPMAAGLLVLAAFVLWERWLARRPGGRPLLDLALFRSPAFTWGVVLTATGALAMVGMIFTMPQFFQAVQGTDAMGSGFRLLPVVAGLIVGALPADRVTRRTGPRVTVAAGFALMAAGLGLGSTTAPGSSTAFVAAWMALLGAGLGLALATAASAALSQLSPERSGVGSAVLQALQKIGGPFGSAIMGSVLIAVYRDRVGVAGLPPAAAGTVRQSVFGGLAVAHQLHSAPLAASVRDAFVHGMDASLVVSAGIAAAGFALALVFLPGRTAAPARAGSDEEALLAARR
jgi:MFS transporter, DHA2 family, multidrug resistance protein